MCGRRWRWRRVWGRAMGRWARPSDFTTMPDFAHELLHHPGLVAGVDEAGRGPLAGPVVAAAVILRQEDCPEGLNDSKQLSAARRAVLEGEIKARALCWGLGVASVEEIDRSEEHTSEL